MSDKRQITELLTKVQSGDEDAASVIVKYFWAAATRVGLKNLNARVRQFQGGSDIANAALRSALSYLGNSKSVFRSRDEFEDLLLDIVRKKAKDAGRRGTAKKRDNRKQVEFLDGLFYASGELADQLAMAEELAEEIEAFFVRESDGERQAILRLAIISKLKGPQIVEVLASSESGAPVRSLRSVQAIAQDGMERLADLLRADYGPLIPGRFTIAVNMKSDGTNPRKKSSHAPSKKKSSTRPGKGRKKRNA